LFPTGRRNQVVIAYMFEERLAGEPFGVESVQQPYLIDQQWAKYLAIPDFLDSQHAIETAGDAEAYLARLRAFGFVLDEETATQRRDATRGLVAPGQIQKLRSATPEVNAMVRSLVARAAAKGVARD